MISPPTETSQPNAVEDVLDDDLLGFSETSTPENKSQTEPPISSPVAPAPSVSTAPSSPGSAGCPSPSETNSAIGWTNSMPSPTASDDTHSLFTGQTVSQDLLQALNLLLTSGNLTTPAPRREPHRRRNVVVCLADPEDVRVVEEALGEHEYDITVATSPEQVTSMLQTSHLLDILLLDPNFHAGQHGGATIMRYLNMLNPARRRRVFVVVTSHTHRTQDLQAAFVHGVNLVVNSADLATLPTVLAKSIQDFNDLYRAFNQVNAISAF